jgi:hypothetical protein
VRSDRHANGFLVVEGIPAFGKALPFAGRRQERRPRSIDENGGSIQPSGRTFDDEPGMFEKLT